MSESKARLEAGWRAAGVRISELEVEVGNLRVDLYETRRLNEQVVAENEQLREQVAELKQDLQVANDALVEQGERNDF